MPVRACHCLGPNHRAFSSTCWQRSSERKTRVSTCKEKASVDNKSERKHPKWIQETHEKLRPQLTELSPESTSVSLP